MNKAAYPLKLRNSVKQAAQRLAKEDGVSLNQWISSAVAQKVGSVETARNSSANVPVKRKAAVSCVSWSTPPTSPRHHAGLAKSCHPQSTIDPAT
jgi:hypothetical protein